MNVVSIGDKKWLTELEWEMLPNEEPKSKEIKNAYERNKCKYGLEINCEGITVVGFSPKILNQPSAMLYLSLANQENNFSDENNGISDWIVIESLGEDSFWTGVVKNGLPAPGFDKVDNLQKTKDKLFDLLQSGAYIIYTKSEEIKYFVEGTVDLRFKGLNELTEEIKTKIKMKKVVGIPNSVIVGGVVLILGLFASVGVSSLIESLDMAEKQKIADQESQAARAKIEADYQRDLAAWEKNKEEIKTNFYKKLKDSISLDSKTIGSNWNEGVLNFEFKNNNWKVENIKCSVIVDGSDLKEKCAGLLSRSVYGTNRLLLEDYPQAKILDSKAEISIDFNKKLSFSPKDLNLVKPLIDFEKKIVSDLQSFALSGVNFTFLQTVPLTYSIPKKPEKPMVDGNGQLMPVVVSGEDVIDSGFAEGKLSVSGTNVLKLKDVLEELQVQDFSLKLENVEYNLTSNPVSWKIEFKYYIKK